jgi:hypothetical protein
MARTVVYSGSQTCTLATDHALQTWDAPTGGATYALVVDAAALANGETLYAYVERETRSTDTRRELFRIGMAAHASSGVVETPFFGAAVGVEIRVGIRQEGGTGRAIPWAIERIDG